MNKYLALFGLLVLAGCGEQYTVYHSQTGLPILLTESAYTRNGCSESLYRQASNLGVTFSYLHVKGSLFGQTLLWPFYKGYSCEAAIGPTRPPSGAYPGLPPLS